jgi:hypothetical protein
VPAVARSPPCPLWLKKRGAKTLAVRTVFGAIGSPEGPELVQFQPLFQRAQPGSTYLAETKIEPHWNLDQASRKLEMRSPTARSHPADTSIVPKRALVKPLCFPFVRFFQVAII